MNAYKSITEYINKPEVLKKFNMNNAWEDCNVIIIQLLLLL